MSRRHFDAIIIGAGFAGIYMLKKLRDELKINVRVFDKLEGIGGTWFSNRYPGALSDTEAFVYCYSWDEEILREEPFNTRYIPQETILGYLEKIAHRHKLYPDIELGTGIVSATFDESSAVWTVVTDRGEALSAKFIITALGLLSAANIPGFPGMDKFAGSIYHTSDWPCDASCKGKRVGVIGTGSTGIQLITTVAPDVAHLVVFQRTPQYSVPAGNGPLSRQRLEYVRENHAEIWQQVRASAIGFGFDESKVAAMSVGEDERRAVFQKAWERGGGQRFMFETFNDITTDEQANLAAQEFIRSKIYEIVNDPETARKLAPTDLYARRPVCDSGYYEVFNRDNVALVDVREHPIVEITEAGVVTADGAEHPLDIIVMATGFDAVDGAYKRIDIRGRGGKSLEEHWSSAPRSHLGMTVAGFPNMFMILGPNSPFSNVPPAIEIQVGWIAELVRHASDNGLASVETHAVAEDNWTQACLVLAEDSLFAKVDSWLFGSNIPGKPKSVYFYTGGLARYQEELDRILRGGYAEFSFTV